MCIFDATHGSLRLTQRLGEHFAEVLETARTLAVARQDDDLAESLEAMRQTVLTCKTVRTTLETPAPADDADGDAVTVVAVGGIAMLVSGARTQEVVVRGHRYTPRGLLYELEPEQPGVGWMVGVREIRPIFGKSPLVRLDLLTGDTVPVSE